ncbi:MAG: hypothetical protein U5J95_12605 [Balneolaceae bacterium]|nr:hypothetical protein [Balneolaceae bacterium]
MQILRSSISKLLVISTLWVGFGLFLIQPASAKNSSEAVDNFLHTVAQKANNTSFQKELNDIRNNSVSEDVLIKKVSAVFAKYNLTQNATLNNVESKQLYKLLLIKWNHLRAANGMAKAPMPEILKPAHAVHVDKFGASNHAGFISDKFDSSLKVLGESFLFENYFDRSLTPMEGGIAIGAP